jgi:hypothetical protein
MLLLLLPSYTEKQLLGTTGGMHRIVMPKLVVSLLDLPLLPAATNKSAPAHHRLCLLAPPAVNAQWGQRAAAGLLLLLLLPLLLPPAAAAAQLWEWG